MDVGPALRPDRFVDLLSGAQRRARRQRLRRRRLVRPTGFSFVVLVVAVVVTGFRAEFLPSFGTTR